MAHENSSLNAYRTLTTTAHQFVLNRDGLIMWELPNDPEAEDYVEPPSEPGYMLPKDAIALAELILANREALEQGQAHLEEVCTPLAETILDVAAINIDAPGSELNDLAEMYPTWSEARRGASDIISAMLATKTNKLLEAWYTTAHRNRYSFDQQREILLMYVRTAYFARTPYYEMGEDTEDK